MFKRLALAALFLVIGGYAFAAFSIIQTCNPCGGGGGSFTPAWQTLHTSGGGALALVHVYKDTTNSNNALVLTTGDSAGPWMYQQGVSCTRDGTTYAAPCFSYLATTDSMPVSAIDWTQASDNHPTAVDVVAAPSNSNVMYMWYNNVVYKSTNKGSTWASTGLTVKYNPNGPMKQSDWMAVDPGNPDIVYLITPNGTYGPTDSSTGTLLVNTTGTTCTSSCWTAISTAIIPVPSGAGSGCGNDANPCGGNIVFDPTSSFSGGKTQGIYVNVGGQTGVYHSTDGGSTFPHVTTGSPPHQIYKMIVDKFSQLWAVEGFRNGGSTNVYRLASGSWTSWTLSTSSVIQSILQDPNTGGLVANNQMIAIDINGQVSATYNNGTDSWAHTIGLPSLSLASSAPQAGWLNVVNQYGSGNLNLNAGAAAGIDPNNGTLWVGTGIDMFNAPDPIVAGALSTTLTYSAATIGIDQLVNNMILVPPGLGVFNIVWDRGVFSNQNPDIFATAQYPNNTNNCSGCQIISGSWGLSYAPGTPATVIATFAGQGGGQAFGVTTNGGKSWSYLGTTPTGLGLSAVVAASTSSSWASVPSDNVGSNNVISYTTNSGSSWATASFSGSPSPGSFISAGSCNVACANRQPLTADPVTAGKYYIVDLSQNFFVCTTTAGVLSCTPTGATSSSVEGALGSDRLMAEPGQANHVWYLGASGHAFKSIDGGATFTKLGVAANLDQLHMIGFGAPKPGGSGCPSVYAFQIGGGTAALGTYASTDCGSTWAALNVPAGEQAWPSHILDFPDWMWGDPDVYGRVYIGFRGFGPGFYIDTADACPWVKISSVFPNDTLAGTVTLQATRSGQVPVTSVSFYYDTTNLIGTQTSGSGTPTVYSQSFNVSGLSTGNHTLSLQVTGNGCTETIASIPFTK